MESQFIESPLETSSLSFLSVSNLMLSPTMILVSLVLGLASLLLFLRRDPRVKKKLEKIPGPPALPIVGNSLALNVPPTELLGVVSKLVEEYGGRFRLWMFNLPYVVVSSWRDAQVIMSSTVHINKSRDYNVMRPWLGNALGLSGGSHWSARRKFLTPAFTFGLQEEFLEVFNEQGDVFTRVLQEEVVGKGEVNLYPYCFRASLDVICEAAMGTKLKAQTVKDVKYLETILGVSGLIVKRILRPWLQPNILWLLSGERWKERRLLKVLHSFTDNIIQERKKKLLMEKSKNGGGGSAGKSPNKSRLAFLDLILEASMSGGGLSDVEIRNETDLFMVAGHDTSGSALAWTLFLLAHHPAEQRKVQEELDEIFADDPTRKVTPEDLTRMKYLEMCLKESLRLRPPIPFIFREIQHDLTMGDGVEIPGGTSVAISIYNLHMDPEVYPDPHKYDPLRFTPENSSARNSYSFVPFAAGPRNCLGQVFARSEGKVMLSWALRKFWFTPAESLDEVQIVPDVNLRPLNGLHFTITQRQK